MIGQDILEKIKELFYKGFNYRLIHYLIQRNHNCDISYNCLTRKVLPRLGLKRRLADIAFDEIFDIAQREILNGCSGAESLRRIIKMKHQLNITRSIARDIVRLLDEDGIKRRKQRRLRRRQYFSKGPNFVWHLDGYDKLKPYGISIHGCIDGFSRQLIWLEADVTNKRPEVVAEYFLNAVHTMKGCPQKIRADPGTENGIIATFQTFLKTDPSAVSFGTSTANQRIERFWGILRQMKADFWMDHFKGLVYEELLEIGNPLHKSCIQFVYLPLIKRDLKDIMDQWNTHSIRRQKLGDTLHGIPEVLFQNPEVVGASNYLHPVQRNVVTELQRLVRNNFKEIDEDFASVASSILSHYNLPFPVNITDMTCARHLYIFLSEFMSLLLT
ncbi:uncharacterized protein LOC133201057 [Saccostrea echinata]|uniref:uncharacterized protein LOC133174433 n=2 Tax=Saccostrea echinata TaxID=191078 RepID=UPI002A808D33|nr:uncharacterized protein LOC133174433 [Saccostrea echinata]XP_061192844.1 uncharacterized protein LOC133201057 [Saccostrea echinata]